MNDSVDALERAPSDPLRHRARIRLTALVLLVTTALGAVMAINASPASAADPIATTRTDTSITWTANGFNLFSGKLTGNTTVTMHQDGSYNFNIHAHQSGVLVRDYAFVCVVTSRSGAVYSFEHHGTVGPRRGGGRTEDWTGAGSNQSIRSDWANLHSGASVRCRMSGGWDVGGMFREMVNPEYVSVYIAVAGAVLAA